MKLQKKYLPLLYQVLVGTNGRLNLAEGRLRDSFLKPLTEALTTFEKNRNEVFEKFCNKDEDGKPIITDNQYHFPPESVKELEQELSTLIEECVELSKTAGLKEILEHTNYQPKIGEVELIDEIITKL